MHSKVRERERKEKKKEGKRKEGTNEWKWRNKRRKKKEGRKTTLAELLPRCHNNKKVFASFALPVSLLSVSLTDRTLIFSRIFQKKYFVIFILFSQVIDNINDPHRPEISGLSAIAVLFAFFPIILINSCGGKVHCEEQKMKYVPVPH